MEFSEEEKRKCGHERMLGRRKGASLCLERRERVSWSEWRIALAFIGDGLMTSSTEKQIG